MRFLSFFVLSTMTSLSIAGAATAAASGAALITHSAAGCGQGQCPEPKRDPVKVDAAVKKLVVGDLLPELTLNGIDGDMIQLSDFRGQVVILAFWFAPCGACANNLATVNQVSQWARTQDIPINVFVVDAWVNRQLDHECNEETAANRSTSLKRIFQEDGLQMPIFPDDAEASIQKLFGVTAWPTTFVIGPDGRIEATDVGAVSHQQELLKAQALAAWYGWRAQELQK